MNRNWIWPKLLVALAALWQGASRAAQAAEPSFPVDFAIVDPNSAEKRPPYIVMFEKGRDKDGNDVRGPIGRLEALRGPSKLFPQSNDDPGLPVVLRGLRFHRQLAADGTARYDVELQGEFNMVKVPVGDEAMQKFLSGQSVTLSLKGEKNFGVYSYVSVIEMDVKLQGEELLILQIEGDFTFREGLFSYTSATTKLTPPPGRTFLYRGERRALPTLPSI